MLNFPKVRPRWRIDKAFFGIFTDLQENLPRYRLSKLFFYFLIFCIPFGTKKVFLTENSFFDGNFLFYNTLYIYLTDILICGLVISWILENRQYFTSFHKILTAISQDLIYKTLGIFWLISAISIIVSRETSLGLYQAVKLLELILLFAYIRENILVFHVKNPNISQSFSGDNYVSRETKLIFGLFTASAVIQALIGILQYFMQRSLGFKWLGESVLVPGMKGIAVFVSHGLVNPVIFQSFGETYNIRAYGTLPHANIFGGLMFMALMFSIYLAYKVSRETLRMWVIFWSFCILMVVTGVIMSFSRTIWLMAFLGVFFWYVGIYLIVRRPQFRDMKLGKHSQNTTQYFPARVALISIVLLFSVALNFYILGPQIKDRIIDRGAQSFSDQDSYRQRQWFNSISLKMIKKNPILGIGLKNFIVRIQDFSKEKLKPELLQPVHNLYLLIASESGVLALLIFLFFIYNIVRHCWILGKTNLVLRQTLLISVAGLLLIGLFDHYLWTIQQGSLAFWIVLGLASARQ